MLRNGTPCRAKSKSSNMLNRVTGCTSVPDSYRETQQAMIVVLKLATKKSLF